MKAIVAPSFHVSTFVTRMHDDAAHSLQKLEASCILGSEDSPLNLIQILILAAIQGAAELLPVSSSAHVIVAEKLMGLNPSSPEMTFLLVMLHTGTMFAVLVYFWKRWLRLLSQGKGFVQNRSHRRDRGHGSARTLPQDPDRKNSPRKNPGPLQRRSGNDLPILAASSRSIFCWWAF